MVFDVIGMGWMVVEDMGWCFGLCEDLEGVGLVMLIYFFEIWYWLEMLLFKVVFEDEILFLGCDVDYLIDLCVVKFIWGILWVLFVCDGEKGKKCYGDYVIVLVLVYFVSWM